MGSFENKSNYAGGFYGDSWGTANVTDSYTVGCVAIDKSFGMPSGIRYSTVSQSQARHGDAQNIAVNVVKEEQIIGESARNAMPELKWDTIWNTVENRNRQILQPTAFRVRSGADLKRRIMREAQVPKKTHTKLLQANSFTKWFRSIPCTMILRHIMY